MATDTLRASTLVEEAKKVDPLRVVPDSPMRPRRGTSQGSSQGYTSVMVDLRPALEAEFENHIYEDADLKDRAFIKIPTKSHIQKFLDESPLYDSKQKRWTAVPEHPQSESDLYRPLTAVIQAIIDHKEFGLSTLRKARDTHNIGMYHNEGAITQSQSSGVPVHIGDSAKEPVRSSPDISIMGVVPDENIPNNFTIFEDKAKSRYNLVLSPVEVKREAANVNLQTNIKQVSVYARQVFRHQSNRFIVNALVMTEKHVYLLVYGRDALHHSTKVDFHEDPATFVRFVLGAASTDGKVAGYDESVYWQNGKRYIKTIDKAGMQVIYPIVDNVPFFDQRSILGRGTCCWCVKAADGTKLIIKDSWRSNIRSPESDLMQMVNELDGVGQMDAFEDRIAVISELRDLDLDALKEKAANTHKHKFQDRILSRLILICYNGSIENFETRTQLLHAFRDAVAGHQNLWNAGILHRDVSLNNIMRGQNTANEKNRGVLIDLDMAILLARIQSLNGLDFRTGTRAYQSVNVLGAYLPEHVADVWPHGVMDDLESFFYVLCWICCGYKAPREILRPFPEQLVLWEDGYALTARSTKANLYLQRFKLPVSPYFGDIFRELLKNLHGFIDKAISARKHELVEFVHPTSPEVQAAASSAYSTFLGHVDDAIAKVKAVGEDNLQKDYKEKHDPNMLHEATPTQANFPQNQASKKRSSQGDEDLDSEHRNKRANASRIPSRLSQRSDVD